VIATFLHALNVFTYVHSIYQFYFDKNLTPKQKLCGTLPRIIGLAVDGAMLGRVEGRHLKIISPHIRGIALPLTDIFAKEESSEAAFCTALSNAVHLHADQESAMLVNALIDKKQFFKKQYIEKIYNYYRLKKISLSLPETIPERIQEKKTEFLTFLKTQDNQLGFIEQILQDYKNIMNHATAESFGTIPYCYMNRAEFIKRKCNISGELVREAVIIKEISLPIYYECDNLSGWYKYKRTILPPAWPKSIPFNRDVIVVDKAETAQITKDLQKALDQTQNNPEELEAIKIGFLAAQELLKDLAYAK
jgi:hypothetical protein